MSKEDLHNRISHDFAPHLPRDDDARGTLNELCAIFEQVGHRAIDLCPEGRHLSLCLTNLEAAKRDAVAAFATGPGNAPVELDESLDVESTD